MFITFSVQQFEAMSQLQGRFTNCCWQIWGLKLEFFLLLNVSTPIQILNIIFPVVQFALTLAKC